MNGEGMVKPLTYGRMGNFLFQAATAMAYALKHGMPFTLPDASRASKDNPVYLQHLVNPKWKVLPSVKITERFFPYQELPFKESWRNHNVILDGYWQTEKYFKWCRDYILNKFGFPHVPRIGTVSVHVRRTDYIQLKYKHPYVSEEWYKEAMKKFPDYKFIFFSDDIRWCMDNFGDRDDCSFSVGQNEVQDLIDMSSCQHHICSASTFSWWGAWLNHNLAKRIIIPKLWFMPGHGGLDTRDIVPAEWEKL